MKIRSFFAAACLIATVSASASYPIYFRDCNGNGNLQGGGFSFPVDEAGNPAFAEDGSITLTLPEGAGGCYIRTKKLGAEGQTPDSKVAGTGKCDASYTVLAFEYKSNKAMDNVIIWHHEIANNHDINKGAMINVTDEYQTCYAMMDRSKDAWGLDGFENHYMWINFNDFEAGWEFTVKNIRLLTIEEASAECQSSTASVIDDSLQLPNIGLAKDYDSAMGCNLYVLNTEPESDRNGILQSASLIKPLPNGVTTYKFDYKVAGPNVPVKLFMHKKWDYTMMTPIAESFSLESCTEDPEEAYEAEWKTFSYDFADTIEAINFAKNFGDNHFIWVQFPGMSEESMMWIKNPRWESSVVGVANVEFVAPVDNRTFNLMGVEIKGELAPGIYIRNGKKFIVR